MNCESVVERLAFYVYGELDAGEGEALEQHLEGCGECRDELERERRLLGALDGRRLEPAPALLAECRQGLTGRILEQAKPPLGAWWRPAAFWQMVSWQPIGALALVALGFFAGRLTSTSAPGIPQAPAPAALLAGLSAAADPSARLQAIEDLRRFAHDARVRKALSDALLKEANPAVRMELADLLIAHRDGDLIGVFQSLVERESDAYISARTRYALRAMKASEGTF
ncbi:MAG: hypothetical protein FJW37_08360 [Acidobacteria bacterium]|nr:hypothetical protein [Acidobacteriota bacterium]